MSKALLWTLVGLAVLLLIMTGALISTVNNKQDLKVPTAQEIAANVVIPAPVVQQISLNSSGLNELNAKEDWKVTAKNLATTEYSEKDNKVLFNFIDNKYGNIDKKTDISKVVVESEKVSKVDTDNQDATVVQKLKVYYEPKDDTDQVKVYLTVTSVIKDGSLDSQKITVTA